MGLSLTATRDGTARFGRSMLIPVRSTALVPRWLAGDGHYTRGASRRTRTQFSNADTARGAANAVSSSGLRRRSSWATIGASASTSSANPPAGSPGRRRPLRVPVPRRSPRRSRSRATTEARPPARGLVPWRASGRRSAPSAGAGSSRGHACPADQSGPIGPRADLPVVGDRAPWSRSSSVVVVTNAWGRAAIRRTRCERRSGSSSEKHVVEQEQRRAPIEGRQEVQLGELEGEDRRALLAT